MNRLMISTIIQESESLTLAIPWRKATMSLSLPSKPMIFLAALGVLIGCSETHHGSRDPSTIKPEPETPVRTPRSLTVIVLDKAKKPVVGVPLAVHVIGERQSQGIHHRFQTGKDGIARIPDTAFLTKAIEYYKNSPHELEGELVRDWAADFCTNQRNFSTVVTFAFPHRKQVVIKFDPENPPETTQVMILPPTVNLVVEVREDSGLRLPGRYPVRLLDNEEHLPPGEGWLINGVARFPFVGAGLKLEATITAPTLSSSRLLPPLRVRTPLAHGSRLVSRLTLPPIYAVVSGKLLGPEGDLLANRNLLVTILRRLDVLGKTVVQEMMETDHAGQFRFLLGYRLMEEAQARLEFRIADHWHVESALATGVLNLALQQENRGLTLDLGEVRLNKPGTVVSGVFQDDQGAPIPGARIFAERHLVGGMSCQLGWHTAYDLIAITDRAGRFHVPGALADPHIRLQARCEEAQPGCHSRRVVVRTGTREVKLVSRPSGSLRGRVIMGPGTQPAEVSVVLHPARELWDDGMPPARFDAPESEGDFPDYPHHPARRARIEKDGSFTWMMVPPGKYTVWVGHTRDPRPAITIRDIQVKSHQAVIDPRLARIDLRGLRRAYRLIFDTPEGCQARCLKIQRGKRDTCHQDSRPTHAFIVTFLKSLDLYITGQGLLDCHLSGVTGERKVDLKPGILARVSLREVGKPAQFPFCLEAFPSQGPTKEYRSPSLVGADGSLRFRVPRPGRYVLRLAVRHRDGRHVEPCTWSYTEYRRFSPVINVTEAPEQRFEITLTPEAKADLQKQMRACERERSRTEAWSLCDD